mgnify:CR=1 FL=1
MASATAGDSPGLPRMEYVKLGCSGLKVSRLCLGCLTFGSPTWRPWVLESDASTALIKRALEYGINFFDTANMYSDGRSEEVLGAALRSFAAREQVRVIMSLFDENHDESVTNLSSTCRLSSHPRSFSKCHRRAPTIEVLNRLRVSVQCATVSSQIVVYCMRYRLVTEEYHAICGRFVEASTNRLH